MFRCLTFRIFPGNSTFLKQSGYIVYFDRPFLWLLNEYAKQCIALCYKFISYEMLFY